MLKNQQFRIRPHGPNEMIFKDALKLWFLSQLLVHATAGPVKKGKGKSGYTNLRAYSLPHIIIHKGTVM